MNEMTTIVDIAEKFDAYADAAIKARDADRKRIGDLERRLKETDDEQIRRNRPFGGDDGGSKGAPVEFWRDAKSGALVPVLRSGESLLALEKKTQSDSGLGVANPPAPNIGRMLRGLVLGSANKDSRELTEEFKALGGNADAAGGYTVSGMLSAEWIDLLRSQMVLSRAGARTVPMEARDVTLARLTGDPTVAWHGENAALGATEPTFGAVSLRAKTVVVLVKLSLELAQDSANLEVILQNSVTQALAQAIDAAGLVGVTTDAAAAPGGIFDLADRNTVTSIGAPTSWDFLVDGMYELMADNVAAESIGAFIAHPAVWKKMRKLKTGITNDNTPLTMPAEVQALPKLWTTAAPLTGGTTAKGIVADLRDLMFGVRQDITVRTLQESFLGSNLQVAMLAYARVDFQATRARSFCTLEGITV
jgi:HK97 family phage major capsid protein